MAAKRVDFNLRRGRPADHLTRSADLAGTNPVATTTNTYDADGHLTGQDDPHGGTVLAADTWKYDPAGEMTQFTSSDGTVNYTYDANGELTGRDPLRRGRPDLHLRRQRQSARAGHVVGPDNELLSDGTYNYAYDARREPDPPHRHRHRERHRRIHYDYRNRLTSVIKKTPPDGDAGGGLHL